MRMLKGAGRCVGKRHAPNLSIFKGASQASFVGRSTAGENGINPADENATHCHLMKGEVGASLRGMFLLQSGRASTKRDTRKRPRRFLPLPERIFILVSSLLVTPKLLGLSEAVKPLVNPPVLKNALEKESLGLFPAGHFQVTSGRCIDCPTPKQALWYFRDELIAVPKRGLPVAGFDRTLSYRQDVIQWASRSEDQDRLPFPPLVWIAAPEILEHTHLSSDRRSVLAPNREPIHLALTPKIPTNRSYYDGSTAAFFQNRLLRIRGNTRQQGGLITFEARTIWPEDYLIESERLALHPLQPGESLSSLIMDENGAAQGALLTRLLWKRPVAESPHWSGKAILGFLLSGAQGDDDESLGGHFAVITGRLGPRGQWADWMVNNFYNLDFESEKGLIASMVPMDNYLMDLNSGQSYYRPAYLLFAVLKGDRTAHRFQGAVERVYNHFYRHDFYYHESEANCTGISVDPLRAIGWEIPRQGPSGYLKAFGAFWFVSAKDLSFANGERIYDYLMAEQTRLLPRVAFESGGQDLLQIVDGGARVTKRLLNPYERMLEEDVEAIIYARIPQIPSSRVFGTYPAASLEDYKHRVPADRSKWKIVPLKSRPFPKFLREVPGPHPRRSLVIPAMNLVALVLMGGLGMGIRSVYRSRRTHRARQSP